MITTKRTQNDYKKITVVKISDESDFVAFLYGLCSKAKS